MNTKKVKKAVNKNVAVAKKKGAELEKMAALEYAKIKKEMDAAAKKVEGYIKKNPAQSAFISAGIGAALGSAIALMASGRKKK